MNSKNSSEPTPDPTTLKYEDSLTVSRLELERYPEHRQVYRETLICVMQDKPGVLFMCEESHQEVIIFRALKYPPSLAEKVQQSPRFLSGGWYRVSTPNPITE